MWEYDEYAYDESLIWSVMIVGICETGASALKYFCDVGNDILPERLLIFGKDDIENSWDTISNSFADDLSWLFVITDIEHLEVAEMLVKGVEEQKNSAGFPSVTILILCPSVDDVRLADIPENFGTWIILPEDKIAETGLTSNELIYRTISTIASIILCINMSDLRSPVSSIPDRLPKSSKASERKYVVGMDATDVTKCIGNFGKACIGFGESQSLDAENAPLDAVKKALKSPLFIEDIGKAKKALLIFVMRRDFVNVLAAIDAANFLCELFNPDPEDVWPVLFQIIIDETVSDGVTAFVLATKFEK